MKKYIVLAGMAFSLMACSDEFLEEKAVTTLTQDYYKTAEGLEILTKGAYHILREKPDYNPGHYLFGIGSDVESFAWDLTERNEMGGYTDGGWSSGATGNRIAPMVNTVIGTIGGDVSEGVYPTVNRCNLFLENYANLTAEEQSKLAVRKGEILFLRTYSYYLLTNLLGDVPLVLHTTTGLPTNFAYKKSSLEVIYKQLINDLNEAVALLPATLSAGDLGRIYKPAAAHLLAKLYLHRAQAADWSSSARTDLKMLYKGSVSTDLDSAIYFSTMVIDQLKTNNPAYGGLQTDFAELWKNVVNNYDRNKCKEIILSAQYEPTQDYKGRYGNTLVHLFNSNYTTLQCGVLRTILTYGRPYATGTATDWGYDMFTDRANDSRYYKTFLTDYYANNPSYDATTLEVKGGKTWDAKTVYYYNNIIKSTSDAAAVAGKIKILYNKTSLVYIENSKDEPLDSLWVVSQPFIMMARWIVGSPNNAGYYTNSAKPSDGFRAGAVDAANPAVISDYKAQNRKIYYRISGDKGEAFGLDRGNAVAQWYMGPRKWLDVNRGKGTDANGNGSFDVPLMRLAETYLIRAEAYGRKGNYASAIDDINVLRKRASYHSGEMRNEVLVKYEPSVLTGKLNISSSEKVAPYKVVADSYSKIAVDGTEWAGGSLRAIKENYPAEASSDDQRFIHFIYNERARELIFEEQTVEDIHNAGIFYERVRDRDMMGAPSSSTGTAAFPFPDDDLNVNLGANGTGKGMLEPYHSFKPWPTTYLQLLTDEEGNALDGAAISAFQNPGY